MAKPSNKIISITLMVIGAGLGFWGYQMSGGLGSQINQALTGSATDKVMMMYIGGAVCFAIGAYMFVKK